jgi:hydrogenase maturation protease
MTTIVVGLGSPHGDDRLGWAAIDLLRPRLPAHVQAVKISGGPGLLERLDGQDQALVIDAAAPSGRPGTIRSFAWPACAGDLPQRPSSSTHGWGLIEALRLAEVLGRLPRVVMIETVEAACAPPGCPALSPAVQAALPALVESILGRFAP